MVDNMSSWSRRMMKIKLWSVECSQGGAVALLQELQSRADSAKAARWCLVQ